MFAWPILLFEGTIIYRISVFCVFYTSIVMEENKQIWQSRIDNLTEKNSLPFIARNCFDDLKQTIKKMSIAEDNKTNLQQEVERFENCKWISELLDKTKTHRKEIKKLVQNSSDETSLCDKYIKILQKFSLFLRCQSYLSNFQQTFSPYQSIFNIHDHFRDKHDETKFGITHINMQSLSKNFNHFVANLFLFERMPDVICITETHFDDEQNEEEYEIPNYRLYVSNRTKSDPFGGGVAIYVNDSFNVVKKDGLVEFKAQLFESLFLEIKTCAFTFICGVAYQTKKESETNQKKIFSENLKNCFNQLIKENKERLIVVCGDFNLDLLKDAPNYFKEYMAEFGFIPCITKPTRYEHRNKKNSEGISRTLIDHIWINQIDRVASSAILVDSFGSDHLAVSCLLQADQSFFPQNCNWNSQNLKLFIDALDAMPWEKAQDDLKVFEKNLAEAVKKIEVEKFALISWKKCLFPKEIEFLHNENLLMLEVQTKFLSEPSQNTQTEIKDFVKKMGSKAMLFFSHFKNRSECVNLICQNFCGISLNENKIAILNEIVAFLDTFNSSSSKSYCAKTERENRMLHDKIKHFSKDPHLPPLEPYKSLELMLCLTGKKVRHQMFRFFARVCASSLKTSSAHVDLNKEVKLSDKTGAEYTLRLSVMFRWWQLNFNFHLQKYLSNPNLFSSSQFGYRKGRLFSQDEREDEEQKKLCVYVAQDKISSALKKKQQILAITFDFSKLFTDIMSNSNELNLKNIKTFALGGFVDYQFFSNYLKSFPESSNQTALKKFFLMNVITDMYEKVPGLIGFKHKHVLLVDENTDSEICEKTQKLLKVLEEWLKIILPAELHQYFKDLRCDSMFFRSKVGKSSNQKIEFVGHQISISNSNQDLPFLGDLLHQNQSCDENTLDFIASFCNKMYSSYNWLSKYST